MAKTTPEGKVKNKIKDIVKSCGGFYCLPIMQGMNHNGTPDMLVCIGGFFIAVEAKAGTNAPTELQKVRLREIQAAGGLAVVVNERGLADFAQLCHTCAHCGDCHAMETTRSIVPATLTEAFSQ